MYTTVARDLFKVDNIALVADTVDGVANIADNFMLGKRLGNSLDGTQTITKNAGM